MTITKFKIKQFRNIKVKKIDSELGQKVQASGSKLEKIDDAVVNCTPKVRQKNSNFWGAFIMKLTYEDKVQIYELRKQRRSFKELSNKFGIKIPKFI